MLAGHGAAAPRAWHLAAGLRRVRCLQPLAHRPARTGAASRPRHRAPPARHTADRHQHPRSPDRHHQPPGRPSPRTTARHAPDHGHGTSHPNPPSAIPRSRKPGNIRSSACRLIATCPGQGRASTRTAAPHEATARVPRGQPGVPPMRRGGWPLGAFGGTGAGEPPRGVIRPRRTGVHTSTAAAPSNTRDRTAWAVAELVGYGRHLRAPGRTPVGQALAAMRCLPGEEGRDRSGALQP